MKLLYILLPILTWVQFASAQADLLAAVARLPQCAVSFPSALVLYITDNSIAKMPDNCLGSFAM